MLEIYIQNIMIIMLGEQTLWENINIKFEYVLRINVSGRACRISYDMRVSFGCEGFGQPEISNLGLKVLS